MTTPSQKVTTKQKKAKERMRPPKVKRTFTEDGVVKRVCRICLVKRDITDYYKDESQSQGYNYVCKDCLRVQQRNQPHREKWHKDNKEFVYKYHKEWIDRNPEKRKAHTILNNAIKSGKIVKMPCVVCNNPASKGHHPDYSKPLEVIWLCQQHHSDIHYGRISL